MYRCVRGCTPAQHHGAERREHQAVARALPSGRPGAALGGVPIHPPLTIRPPTLCLPRSSVGVSGSHVVPHPSPAELTAEPKARAERIPSRRPEPSRAKLSERASRATAPFGTGRAHRRPPLECRVQGAGYRASCTLGGHPSRPFRRSHLASQPTLAHSRNRSPSPPGTVGLICAPLPAVASPHEAFLHGGQTGGNAAAAEPGAMTGVPRVLDPIQKSVQFWSGPRSYGRTPGGSWWEALIRSRRRCSQVVSPRETRLTCKLVSK